MRRIDPWFAIGLVAFFALLFVALFGERIAPYEPIYFVVNRGDLQRPFAPGEVYPLGSDVLGRDLLAGLARVFAGLAIAVAASCGARCVLSRIRSPRSSRRSRPRSSRS